ncbi:MAG: DUF4199 domain-containing protein [Flavobacteriaceae bacterium]|uniref:DUF4199 domain-containing protein n=1 Tax=Flagellimonas algarum TaxID=3230298 RepID=UPI003394FC8E|nr:DUF4199 domain-containing protein [Flavobacteriaceae bacterium]
MEGTPPKTGKFSLNYGALLGLVGIVFGFMLYSADMHYEQGWEINAINLVIMAGIIIFGIAQFRKANAGYLTLGQAMKVGLGIALVGFVIGIIYQMIFINVIEPEFMDNMMEIRKAEMIAQNPNMTQEQVDNATEMMKKFSGPGMMIAFGALASIFFGAIFSLIGGLILKKAQPTY